MIDWDELRFFVVLCRKGSFAAAGKELRVDETTVARRLSRLEAKLGARLFVRTFTVGLTREVAGEGIRVNAVRPGVIDTEIHASGGLPARARQLAPTIPLLRPGAAAEVARAVLWLLGPEASYTTGALLDVSGGR